MQTLQLLLVVLLVVPLLGALLGALVSGPVAKTVGLVTSLATLLVAIGAAASFDWNKQPVGTTFGKQQASLVQGEYTLVAMSKPGTPPAPEPEKTAKPDPSQPAEKKPTQFVSITLGADAVAMVLVLLTAGLMPLAVAASFGSIHEREREYYAWMSTLLAFMLGVFLARDSILFYVFFELTLIPMFFIIGIWGGPARRPAAAKFFLFTFAGGVFTLASIIFLGATGGSFAIADLVRTAQDPNLVSSTQRFWVFMGLLAGFAVKVPLFPVHTWLPLAHTEAPTAGSVILAGVLLKLGTYGLLILAIPAGLVPAAGASIDASLPVIHFLGWICCIGIVYGALVAWVQKDIKKLVAYSSVSHLGFCVLGLLAMNTYGMQGSVLYMVNHGISTGAMFLCIGMIYDRYHTRDINQLSGLFARMPILGTFFVLFVMSSVGLPGTNGFVSEFMTISAAFWSRSLGITFGVVAASGILLGALYMLHMTARVMFGPLKTPLDAEGANDHGHDAHAHDAHAGHGKPGDIGLREVAILTPLALAVVLLGFFPNLILGPIAKPLELSQKASLQQAEFPKVPAVTANGAAADQSPTSTTSDIR